MKLNPRKQYEGIVAVVMLVMFTFVIIFMQTGAFYWLYKMKFTAVSKTVPSAHKR